MSIPIADLHCDLLCYLLADAKRTPFDPVVKCSIPQLESGPVRTQVMAVFCETAENSVRDGMAQVQRFIELKKEFPQIEMFISLENGSTVCSETKNLSEAFKRIDDIQLRCGGIFYISLTWNTENRFGGGAHTTVGLKEDGKRLLEYLDNKQIAVDLSHTSDQLAHDILNFIDKNNFKIPVLASHSNFRVICDVPRNLPDELVKEIFNRRGVIGLNFVGKFMGTNGLAPHVEHGLKLGGEDYLCFGADFFYEWDVPEAFRKPTSFLEGYNHAGCYQKIIRELGLSESMARKLAHENFYKYADSYVLLTR